MNETDALQNQVHEDLFEILTSEETETQTEQPTDAPVGSPGSTVAERAKEECAECEDESADGASTVEEPEGSFLSPDEQNQDSDPIVASEDPTMARMRALEAELADLRAELSRRNEEAVKIERECEAFQSLYLPSLSNRQTHPQLKQCMEGICVLP